MQPVGDEPAVFGTARGDRGTAVEDVTIRLLMLGTSNVIAAAQSDQKGEFQFSGIKPGAYYLEISVDGHVVTGAKLRVRKGHPLAVVLTWQPLRPGEFCL